MNDDLGWITWLLVIVGWWIVNHTSNKRETRKEARATIDAAKREVQIIAKAAVAYFTDLQNTQSDDIKSALDLFEVELERLDCYTRSVLSYRLADFHEACTGADFESAARVVHGPASEVVRNIALSRHRLVAQLELHYRVYYL